MAKKDIGIFLIHGATKTTKELVPIKNALEKDKKISVHLPLLPGHGTCPYDNDTCLKHFWETTPEKWLDSAEKEFNEWKKDFKKVYIGGISVGGSISLFLAAKYKDIDGVILFGTPIFLAKILSIAYSLSNVVLWTISKVNKQFNRASLNGQYHGLPIAKIMKIKLFIDESKKKLPEIRQPILIFHSKRDDIASPKSVGYLARNLGSKRKEIVWMDTLHGVDINSEEQVKFVSTKISNFIREP